VTEKVRSMSLYRRNFDKIVSGQKTIEVRVAYDNNRNLAAGQALRFFSGDDDCLTRIVRVTEYPSFEAMLDSEDPLAIGFEPDQTRDDMLSRVREIYPPEKEALGVLAIEIERQASSTT
jgi:ASC-1-like (ASCH) protein